VKALRYDRSLPRFAAARLAGSLAPGRGAGPGPLRLVDADPPLVDAPGWVRVRPRLAGICGSDLATIDATSSRWFEPVVSFPFVPGHEVVGDLDDGTRVVLQPVLGCAARGIEPACEGCAGGQVGRCRNITFGHLEPGLQTGYCADTGGGWSTALVAHETQLHRVPDDMSDEAAVMVEPAACAVRGAGKVPAWFEPVVSFPFVPGHEVVGTWTTGRGSCSSRCSAAPPGHRAPLRGLRRRAGRSVPQHHLRAPRARPADGYCADTGGGWSTALVAHETQLHRVPDAMSDEAAVMVEPAACAIRGAGKVPAGAGVVAVIGAGTLGLAVIAALRHLPGSLPATVVAAAKHPEQRALARRLGADVVVEPDELARAVRRSTGTMAVGSGASDRLTGGAEVTVDCVGSAETIATALDVTAPGGTVVLVGMPGRVDVDLTPLWQRELSLVGAYAYGTEAPDGPGAGRPTFELAFELVQAADLGGLVSATYPLARYADAIAHAAEAGRRGAVKIAFDLRNEKERNR
jgi:threonine dehydrogenase-like Zn-dependent dehydrogenase